MKPLSKKSITFSIILLFIGVSLSSGISIDTKTTQVDDCGCKEVSDADLIKVERLFDRVEVYCKSVLVLSRYDSEVKERCDGILDLITSNIISELLCETLMLTIASLYALQEYLLSIGFYFGMIFGAICLALYPIMIWVCAQP